MMQPCTRMCRSKRVEQLINIGIITSNRRLHLVGYFYMICTMMHGTMNIKEGIQFSNGVGPGK